MGQMEHSIHDYKTHEKSRTSDYQLLHKHAISLYVKKNNTQKTMFGTTHNEHVSPWWYIFLCERVSWHTNTHFPPPPANTGTELPCWIKMQQHWGKLSSHFNPLAVGRAFFTFPSEKALPTYNGLAHSGRPTSTVANVIQCCHKTTLLQLLMWVP